MGTASTTKFLKSNGGSFLEVAALTTSAGAGDAQRLVALNASGFIDDTMMNASNVSGANKVAKMNASGILDDTIINAKNSSAGAGDAGKIPKLNASGILDDTITNASATTSAGKLVKMNGSGFIDDGILNAKNTSAGAGDAGKIPKLNASGILDDTIINATVTSANNKIVKLDATGKLDSSVMPVGIGDDAVNITASEALAAGDLVNVYSNAGTANVRKADASTTGKEAWGFVLAAVASSASAKVYFEGTNTQRSGMTVGTQFLSATTAGATTSTAPSTAGQIVQIVGMAVSATSMNFDRGDVVVLA